MLEIAQWIFRTMPGVNAVCYHSNHYFTLDLFNITLFHIRTIIVFQTLIITSDSKHMSRSACIATENVTYSAFNPYIVHFLNGFFAIAFSIWLATILINVTARFNPSSPLDTNTGCFNSTCYGFPIHTRFHEGPTGIKMIKVQQAA